MTAFVTTRPARSERPLFVAAALVAAGGFVASAYTPGYPWNAPQAASLAIALSAWLWTGIAKTLQRFRADDIWGKVQRLTQGPGEHQIKMNPGGTNI